MKRSVTVLIQQAQADPNRVLGPKPANTPIGPMLAAQKDRIAAIRENIADAFTVSELCTSSVSLQ
jgi:hypothetical protein